MKTTLLFGLLFASVAARKGFGNGEQDWEFVNVRPNAYEFWWLYETTADVPNITDKPLVIWLQGGPGVSSTGYGNFVEIGPLDKKLKPRVYTWVKDVNLLFIDNPVGTGYSYVTNNSAFTTNNSQIAIDLISCLEGFYQRRPEFRKVPLYITSESYGGKMAAEFALLLYKKIENGAIKSNLKGVNMIDSWISPLDSILHWAPFLLNVGAIDQQGYEEVNKAAQYTKKLFDGGYFEKSTRQWLATEHIIMDVTRGVDFYNILEKVKTSCSPHGRMFAKLGSVESCIDETDETIERLMNTEVKEALNISGSWGEQGNMVFGVLSDDFMKPVTHIIERLLNETTLKVQVVSGQLDLIVDTPGTIVWVDRLRWNGTASWSTVQRAVISVNDTNEGYKKSLGNFAVYWVNRAGHMVPADNPNAMGSILDDLCA